MRTLRTALIQIGDISNQDEFMGRLDEQRIQERAASIDEMGLLSEPIVREADMRLVSGRDRAAAHVLLGRPTMLVKLVEASDDDVYLAEIHENMHRRHNAEEQRDLQTKAIKFYADREVRSPTPKPKARKTGQVGRPKGSLTPIGKARELVAGAKGIKPESVRRAETRNKAEQARKAVMASNEGMPEAVSASPIKTLGMDVGPEFLAQAAAVQGYILEAAGKVSGAGRHITQLKNAEVPFPSALLQRLAEDIHDLQARIRLARPVSLCPHCKGLSGVQEECAGCSTIGYITEGQRAGVPPALWTEGKDAVVQYRGQTVRIDSLIEGQADDPEASFSDDPFA